MKVDLVRMNNVRVVISVVWFVHLTLRICSRPLSGDVTTYAAEKLRVSPKLNKKTAEKMRGAKWTEWLLIPPFSFSRHSRRSLGFEHNDDEKERPEEWDHPQMTATRLREYRGWSISKLGYWYVARVEKGGGIKKFQNFMDVINDVPMMWAEKERTLPSTALAVESFLTKE